MQFLESDFTLRDEESHQRHCTELEGESGSKALKLYGINRDSILNKLAYFHVCSGVESKDCPTPISDTTLFSSGVSLKQAGTFF